MAAYPESLRDVLCDKELLWLAGEQAYQAGTALCKAQKVEFTRTGVTHLRAIVTDAGAYAVSVSLLQNGDIQFSCECPKGALELFCEHCTAASLAWLSDSFDATEFWSEAMSALGEIDEVARITKQLRQCLNSMDREDLVDTILEWARIDPLRAQDLLHSQRFAFAENPIDGASQFY